MSYNKNNDKCLDNTLIKLKELARKYNIKGYSKMNKNALCNLLIENKILKSIKKDEIHPHPLYSLRLKKSENEIPPSTIR